MVIDTIITFVIAYIVGLTLYFGNELNQFLFGPGDEWQPRSRGFNVLIVIINILIQISLAIVGLALIAFIQRWVHIPPGGAWSVIAMGCGFLTCQLLEKYS